MVRAHEPSVAVLFCAAAGARLGYGHLIRCRSLARALNVPPVVALRGGAAARTTAARLGVAIVPGRAGEACRRLAPRVIVVDDPSAEATARWVARARGAAVPVATIHDLGCGYLASDLLIDGSVRPGRPPAGTAALLGPAYTILDPSVTAARQRLRWPRAGRVLIALGGGCHVRAAAARLTAALAARVRGADIHVAAGFFVGAEPPPLPAGAVWVHAPGGLLHEFLEADIAIVAGGISLYEACALGVPAVGLAVTAAQHETIRAVARQGAVIDGVRTPLDGERAAGVADAAARLLADPVQRTRLAAAARRVVDARGAVRVARAIERLTDGESLAHAS